MNPIPNKKCDECDGTGCVNDNEAIGDHMRKLRVASKLSLREIARRLNLSGPYVSDLERGHRGWSHMRITEFENACDPDYKTPPAFNL
jgi:predicted transcriptional regulator